MEFSIRSKERMSGVDSRLVDTLHLALSISKIDFGIPLYGGVRSEDDQLSLFIDGKSMADGITNRSKHQDGKAVDVYAYVDGKASWKEEHLAMVACAVLQAAAQLGHEISWGGLFKSFKDMPHFQIR